MAAQPVKKWKIESSAFWHGISFPRSLKSCLILFSHCPFSLGSDSDIRNRKNSTELSVIGTFEEAMESWLYYLQRDHHVRARPLPFVNKTRKVLSPCNIQLSQLQSQIN